MYVLQFFSLISDGLGGVLKVEITAFRLKRIFQPMIALKFITGNVVTRLIIRSYRQKRP